MVESQPGAAGLAVGLALAAQAWEDLGRDALAVVMNLKQYFAVFTGQADRDRSPVSQGLDAVVYKVGQEAFELRGLDFGEEAVRRLVESRVYLDAGLGPELDPFLSDERVQKAGKEMDAVGRG